MSLSLVDQIAKAVLYEGYMLYPYRPSSVKNRQRFNFGVLYPQAYSQPQSGQDPSSMQIECLIRGGTHSILEVRLRFLHLSARPLQPCVKGQPEALSNDWQEAGEREVAVPTLALEELCRQPLEQEFAFADQLEDGSSHDRANDGGVALRQERVAGSIEITAQRLRADVFKIRIRVGNRTPLHSVSGRDHALMRSLVSTHLILGVQSGEFVSLLDPPAGFEELAALCQNIGAWPVLVGEPGRRDTMLASPIILYDYPQIAPESAGDLFDGTEIDEILSLRIMTLTDDEKREIRQSDDRARQILERTEAMPAEQFLKLHGAVRGLRPVQTPHHGEES
jgi:hypothetical protein